MKILFLDTNQGMDTDDPVAYLVEIDVPVSISDLKAVEKTLPKVFKRGATYIELLTQANIDYRLISQGRKSDYTKPDYNKVYNLIEGDLSYWPHAQKNLNKPLL